MRGVALPGAVTALPQNCGVVVHCEDDGQARDLRVNLQRPDVLPPGWRVSDGPDDVAVADTTTQRAAFALGSPLELSLSPARLDGGGTHGRGGWLRK